MKRITLMAIIVVMFLFFGCGTSKKDIDRGLSLCEGNGGLKMIYQNKVVLCENGAQFQPQ